MLAHDDVFDALAQYQRRELLVGLLHRDPHPVPELSEEGRELLEADEALLREFAASSRELPTADESLVLLYHVHLPMLTELGFITWHRDAHVVTKGKQFDDVKPLLELVAEQQDHRLETDADAPLQS